MTFEEWMQMVREIKEDPVWRMEAYRLSLFAADIAWPDVTKLIKNKRTIGLADQLYRAAGAVSSDIAEGYSRQSGRDQARYYEYALGSTREARNWYYEGRHILTERVASHRIQLLTHVARLLMRMIPNERGYRLHEDSPDYSASANAEELLSTVPAPPDVS